MTDARIHTRSLLRLFASALVFAGTPAPGQGQEVTLGRDGGGTNVVVSSVQGLDLNEPNVIPGASTELTIRCPDDGVDCSAVEVSVVMGDARSPLDPTSSESDAKVFTLGPGSFLTLARGAEATLEIQIDGTSVDSFRFVRTTSAQQEPPPATGSAVNASALLGRILGTPCAPPGAATAGYSSAGDLAAFVVTPVGTVLAGPRGSIDEDDVVLVHMSVPEVLRQRVAVRRTSPIRDLTTVPIAGGSVTVPSGFMTMSGGEVPCVTITAELRDFASGRAEVGIFVRSDDGEEKAGSFEFAVSPLYFGSFSLGPVVSNVAAPTFGTVSNGTADVVTVTERGDPVHYVLMFTPFVWGRRDFAKDIPRRARVNPSVGIGLKDLKENAFVGLSVDFGNVVFVTYGFHWSKVTRLDETGGAAIDEPIPGGGNTVPTTEVWTHSTFYGVTVDLRAATQFFGRLLTGQGGSSD